MKTTRITAAVLATAALAAGAAHAANTTGTANATVIGALTVAETQQLSFGSFSAGPVGGSINSVTGAKTGDVVIVSGPQAGKFRVTGNPNTAYSFTVSPSVTLTGPGTAMTASISGSSVNGGLTAAGIDDITTGGTLTVNSNQASGAYTGTYNVTVNY